MPSYASPVQSLELGTLAILTRGLTDLRAGSRDDGGLGKAPQKGYGQAWVGHSVGFHKPTAVYERETHRIQRTVLITTIHQPLLQALGLSHV